MLQNFGLALARVQDATNIPALHPDLVGGTMPAHENREHFMDDEVVGFTDAPSAAESKKLARLGQELTDLDTKIDRLKKELEETSKRRNEMAFKEIPDFMERIGQDKIGLPGSNVDLVLEPYYHANIAAEWEPERREKAFAWLEKHGHGDLIKTTVSITFPRRALAAAHFLVAQIKKISSKKYTIPEPEMAMGVPWNTLTAFVKEQVEKGVVLPLDTLGATVGRIVKVKGRKK
jgi:hypothetical protein